MRWLQTFLFRHPFVKALGTVVSIFLPNVLAGAYVFEITKTGPNGVQYLDWAATPHTSSFWVFLVVAAIMTLYILGVARFDRKVQSALSDADIRAQAYRHLIPALLDHYKKEIEAGNLTPMAEVMRMLGIDGGEQR
jgi:hypothetical protein